MMHSADFIVMGAGVVGLCAAIALRRRGYAVLVLEAGALDYPLTDPNSRVYALNQASQRLLQQIGVWDTLDSIPMGVYERMQVWDAFAHATIAFDARMLACDRLGVILEEAPLKYALLALARELNITFIEHWVTQTMEEQDHGVMVRSLDQSWSAKYMIIAEGARSSTRELLQVPMTSWSYQQHAIVAKVAVEHPHAQTAYQVFGAKGPLAFLPLADPNRCSIVWSCDSAYAEQLMLLSDADFEQALSTAFEHTLGATGLLSARRCFPLHMQHAKQYAGARWVLMGDAAHTIHPLAGLGLNLGLADVRIFLQSIANMSQPNPRALRAYQRHRKHELWQVILFLQSMHVLFTSAHLPLQIIRGIGLRLCHRLPMLKRLCMEHASGCAI
ncbi:MAG: 2-polyprenyl-6-methoxyphenol hydroxylase [Legionella sp.]|nr:MAG: 2-polyprenyl-6-methoxyphenol hydroxylase [Legionella sp.]